MFTNDEAAIRRYFWWSVVLKAAISLAEVAGGLVLIFVPATVLGLLSKLPFAGELLVAGSALLGFYLLSRGLIKVALIAAMLKNQLWAYPASLVVLGLFIIYQVYEIVAAHSALMLLVTMFDLVVVYFIWQEWQVLKRHPRMHPLA